MRPYRGPDRRSPEHRWTRRPKDPLWAWCLAVGALVIVFVFLLGVVSAGGAMP